MINFKIYPSTNRVPGVFAEVDPSKANTAQNPQRALMLGQVLAGATYAANIPVISTGYGDAAAGAGGASAMLAQMVDQYRKSDTFGELWLLPLNDNGAGVQASGTVTFTGPATAAGTQSIYVAGELVAFPVAIGDTADAQATNFAAAVAAAGDLPVTAAVAVAVVTLTAVHKGLAGNDIDLRANFLGALSGEYTPAGTTVVFSGPQLTGGTSNPLITTALANISADQTFDFIACPYNDATTLNALQAFLNDTTGRWSWQQELFGGVFYAFRGTLSGQTTFGTSRNNQHETCMGFYDSPTPVWRLAADVAANSAVSIRANPATPLQDMQLNVKAPPLASRFDISERNTMLYDGMSTFKVDNAGQVFTDRLVTTYQTTNGVADDSYLDVETMYTLQFAIRDMIDYLSTNFNRMILVADGTPIAAGSGMCTSKTILNSAIARYRFQASQGLMQNPDDFANNATAENAGNGLVQLLLPFELANQLRQIAMLIQFTKP